MALVKIDCMCGYSEKVMDLVTYICIFMLNLLKIISVGSIQTPLWQMMFNFLKEIKVSENRFMQKYLIY